jgi:hypothetical protein
MWLFKNKDEKLRQLEKEMHDSFRTLEEVQTVFHKELGKIQIKELKYEHQLRIRNRRKYYSGF